MLSKIICPKGFLHNAKKKSKKEEKKTLIHNLGNITGFFFHDDLSIFYFFFALCKNPVGQITFDSIIVKNTTLLFVK